MTNQVKDLFQLQAELVDMKVEMAVSKAIDRVIEKINDLKTEVHDLRHEMKDEFSSLDRRVVAIETRLGMNGERRKAWYERTLDFIFKAAWAWSSVALFYLMTHFHLALT